MANMKAAGQSRQQSGLLCGFPEMAIGANDCDFATNGLRSKCHAIYCFGFRELHQCAF
jgi:hypothetical protein